jgi:hypothetical protein
MFIRCQESGCGIGADPNHDSQWDITCGVRNCYLKRQFQSRNKKYMLLIIALVGFTSIMAWVATRPKPPKYCNANGLHGDCISWRIGTE